MNQVSIGDVELGVERQGRGESLLLVHGFPLDHRMWNRQIEDLSKDFDVIAPDLRGFGASGPAQGQLTMDRFADDLASLLDAIGLPGPVTFCGLSMGGYIGWQFWERHPGRVSRLILCDTRAAADSASAAQAREETAQRALREGIGFLADGMVGKLLSAKTLENQPDLVTETQRAILSCDPTSVAAALRGMSERSDMTPRLAEIQVPTLLLCGEDDAITPVEEMRALSAALPNATFSEVPGAGHLAPLENPAASNLAMREFLLS